MQKTNDEIEASRITAAGFYGNRRHFRPRNGRRFSGDIHPSITSPLSASPRSFPLNNRSSLLLDVTEVT
ncbi:hypothetical protein DNTS_030062 [Danionella cerebrum]|uniref:Uncharacterized protein n=1 Tax=Danionella cerebrum TaxID=2873325 RepID=A0A553NJ38_9TELE|nr:hypothetical protein DNTS_030062 [Danionella translucida]